MKSLLKTTLFSILTLSFLWISADEAQAQWQIGASFEMRSEVPENGIGLQFEKHFTQIPLFNIRTRLHGSYFTDDDSFTLESVQGGNVPNVDLSREVNSFDFGGAIILELGLPMLPVRPYVGLGGGFEFFNVEVEDAGDQYGIEDFNEDSFYYYGVIGASVTLIPVLTPFIEYRFSGFNYEDEPQNQQQAQQTIEEAAGRLMIGVSLRF